MIEVCISKSKADRLISGVTLEGLLSGKVEVGEALHLHVMQDGCKMNTAEWWTGVILTGGHVSKVLSYERDESLVEYYLLHNLTRTISNEELGKMIRNRRKRFPKEPRNPKALV